MNLRHYKELDGIRAIAALMVMVLHFAPQIPDGPINILIKKAALFGQTGVTLFFVLSGFLITRILLSTKGNNNYFQAFYVRRAFRIFPLYYLFLVISIYLIPSLKGSTIHFNESWHFWIYLQNVASTFDWPINGPFHFWSLAVEEHFYLFWPFIIYCFNEKQIFKIIVSIILIAFATRIVLASYGYGSFYFTLTNMDALAIGGLIALQEKNNTIAKARIYLIRFTGVLLIISLIGPVVSGQGFNWFQMIKLPLFAFLYYYLILFVITAAGDNKFKQFLASSPLTLLGKISYGLYVYHPLCFEYLGKYFTVHNWVLDLVLQFSVAIAVSLFSFYAFESIFLKQKKYFAYAKNKNPLSSPHLRVQTVRPVNEPIENK